MSLNNVRTQGSLSNVGSLQNIPQQGSLNTNTQNNNQGRNDGEFKLEGSLFGNVKRNTGEITAGITSLVGGILGYDLEARQALKDLGIDLATNPEGYKTLFNMLLSTYNTEVDDFGNLPLGTIVGNVVEGAWQHPVEAGLDIASLGVLSGVPKVASNLAKNTKFGKTFKQAEEIGKRAELAAEVTKDNLDLNNFGRDLYRAATKIESKYSSKDIGRAMDFMENHGVKFAPKELRPVINDLSRMNDIYKQFAEKAGAQLYDDLDLATLTYMSNQAKIPFEWVDNPKIRETNWYQDTMEYVRQAGMKPIFHINPKVNIVDADDFKNVESNLLQRKYGNMAYFDAGEDLAKKTAKYIDSVVRYKTSNSAKALNDKIDAYNKATNSNLKKLDTGENFTGNRFIQELNTEMKKNMLGGGLYLASNIIGTTLSILNNWNGKALKATAQNLPQFRKVHLSEAKTPGLNYISKLNNFIYQPIASIDKFVENVALEYARNLPEGQWKLMQSAMPSLVTPSNVAEQAAKTFIPFASYPIASAREIIEHVKSRPIRSLIYNQIPKIGGELNERVQENIQGLKEVDPTKTVRQDEQGNLYQRATVVTPIQALSAFLLGTAGDALQVPVFKFVQDLISGKGDPNTFVVDGQRYEVENGFIKTDKGDFNLLPSIAYVARNFLAPLQFYNQVLVPLLSDKIIKDKQTLSDRMINDAEYSSMSNQAKKKVTTKAREKLGKRLLGTFEYNYYQPYVSKTRIRKIRRQERLRREIQQY